MTEEEDQDSILYHQEYRIPLTFMTHAAWDKSSGGKRVVRTKAKGVQDEAAVILTCRYEPGGTFALSEGERTREDRRHDLVNRTKGGRKGHRRAILRRITRANSLGERKRSDKKTSKSRGMPSAT